MWKIWEIDRPVTKHFKRFRLQLNLSSKNSLVADYFFPFVFQRLSLEFTITENESVNCCSYSTLDFFSVNFCVYSSNMLFHLLGNFPARTKELFLQRKVSCRALNLDPFFVWYFKRFYRSTLFPLVFCNDGGVKRWERGIG